MSPPSDSPPLSPSPWTPASAHHCAPTHRAAHGFAYKARNNKDTSHIIHYPTMKLRIYSILFSVLYAHSVLIYYIIHKRKHNTLCTRAYTPHTLRSGQEIPSNHAQNRQSLYVLVGKYAGKRVRFAFEPLNPSSTL